MAKADSKLILIADDEQACIDFVRDILTDMPYEIVAAKDGEEALKAARAQKPKLIILDVHMPKKDGFSVFSELRKDKDLVGIPVIMLTAIAEKTGVKFTAEDMGEYIGSEPEIYIDKPSEPIILKQAIKKLMK